MGCGKSKPTTIGRGGVELPSVSLLSLSFYDYLYDIIMIIIIIDHYYDYHYCKNFIGLGL